MRAPPATDRRLGATWPARYVAGAALPETARGFFNQALVLDPANVRARQALAAMAEQDSDYREALRLCQEIQQLAPRTPGNDDCIRRNQVRVAGMGS
jgi:cytochrome c-type biogenesis protein CcmH/NrfG